MTLVYSVTSARTLLKPKLLYSKSLKFYVRMFFKILYKMYIITIEFDSYSNKAMETDFYSSFILEQLSLDIRQGRIFPQ